MTCNAQKQFLLSRYRHWRKKCPKKALDKFCECDSFPTTTTTGIWVLKKFEFKKILWVWFIHHHPHPQYKLMVCFGYWGSTNLLSGFVIHPPPLNPRCKLLFSLGLKYHTLINWLKNGTWLSHIFLCSYDFLIQIYIYIQILLSVVPATEIILYFLEAVHVHQLYIVHACIKPRSCPLKLIG